MSRAPYRRVHKHGKGRGNEATVICGMCGKKVPKYKTFAKHKGFFLDDPSLQKEISRKDVMTPVKKMYVCLSCARRKRISQPLKSRKSGRSN